MKLRRSLISLLLVLCMIMQSFVPVWAQATSKNGESKESISDAREKFNKAYDEIMAIKEVEIDDTVRLVINGKDGWDNLWSGALFDDSKEKVDHVAEIEEANRNIKEAQDSMTEMKAKFDSGKIDAAENANADEIVSGALTAQSEAQAALQGTLWEAGNDLKSLGEMIDTLCTIITIIEAICVLFMWALPAILGPILTACQFLDKFLPETAIVLKGVGQGLMDTAESGNCSDAVLVGNVLWDTGTEFAKDKAMDLLGDSIGKELGGAWDMNDTVMKDMMSDGFGDDVTKKLADDDLYKNFVYKELEKGGKELNLDNASEYVTDKLADGVNSALDLANMKPDVYDGKKTYQTILDEGVDAFKPACLKGNGAGLSAE